MIPQVQARDIGNANNHTQDCVKPDVFGGTLNCCLQSPDKNTVSATNQTIKTDKYIGNPITGNFGLNYFDDKIDQFRFVKLDDSYLPPSLRGHIVKRE